ncbi:hypothetical protein VNI00_005859 [Paramarasmius palmivorus]|uniref:Coilin n=1 Tax=Paramarasmius palmivorus TaxID=297713 RepID=A0AAW0DE26_9AGAR
MSTRLRLQTDSPGLPSLKAWFSFRSEDVHTVRELKKQICKSVKVLDDAKISSGDIIFELSGFELLDELHVDGLLKEEDLIVVRSKPGSSSNGKKRKAEENAVTPSKRRKETHYVSSSESESSSSEESDESSSESSSDTSSSEESSSDSEESESESDSNSDSSSSAPSTAPIKVAPKFVPSAPQEAKEKKQPVHHIPPGHGSAQTQKRNQRRRLKKKHEAAAKGLVPPPLPPPKGTSSTNLAPLGTKSSPVSEPQKAESQPPYVQNHAQDDLNLSMFSLGNKNKKKGFKQTMTLPSSQKKIIFDFESAASDLSLPFASAPIPAPTHPSQPNGHRPLPRLIPPSEKQEKGLLPPNMFVTSVDVEAGSEWQRSKKKKSRKGAVAEANAYLDEVPTQRDQVAEEEQVTLDYGEALVAEDGMDVDSKAVLVWTVADNTFDSLPSIQRAEGQTLANIIRPGIVIGWKALALNPATFSPEIMLQLATVLSTSPDSSAVSIRKMIRPGSEDYTGDDELDETVAIDTVFESGWKVIDNVEAE